MKIVLLIASLICPLAFAQPLNLNWAKTGGSTGNDYAFATTVDHAGNIYYTGQFSGTVDFDPGLAAFPLTSLGVSDLYVCKLDNNGNFLWALSVGSSGTTIAQSVAVDSTDNVYIGGSYTGFTDFDPGPGTTILPVDINTASQAFVAKYTSSGTFVWGKGFGGSQGDYGYGISIRSNTVYVTGRFAGTTDFDPTGGIVNYTSAGSADAFVSKFDLNGNFYWARPLGGTAFDYASSVAVNSQGMVYITGGFQGNFDADPGAAVNTLSNSGVVNTYDIFIWKLNSAGDYQNAFDIGSSNDDVGNDITIDNLDNVYTTGWFVYSVDFDPAVSGTSILTPIGGIDAFLLKMDVNDAYQWARNFGGSLGDLGRSVTTTANNDLVITGKFSTTADFDPGPGTQQIVSNGGTDIYLAGISSSGSYQWAAGMGSNTDDDGRDAMTDASGNIFAVGFYTDTADFNPRPINTNLNSAGLADLYAAKYHLCVPNNSTISPTACYSYQSPSNQFTWTTSGTYHDTLVNFEGCDSLITIHLTIDTVNVDVNVSNGTFSANQLGGTYQWIDCNTQTNIPGATSQQFTPTLNGDYAVIISNNGCTDTSNCYNIMNVGLESVENNVISIYPNPATHVINISSSTLIQQITLMDVSGKVVQYYPNVNQSHLSIYMAELSKGIYLLSVQTPGGITSKRIIKD
jgi:hypothetical protein